MEQDWATLGERVIALAQRLVAVPSVHGTAGEAQCIELLAAHLRTGLAARLADDRAELHIVEVDRPAHDGSGPAKALLAWLAPPAGVATDRALGLMGHVDTVAEGAECRVQRAESQASGDHAAVPISTLDSALCTLHWLSGRGWLDMKGGVAAIAELFLAQAQADAADALPAHLLLLLTTDEEDASRGVYALLPTLRELQERRGLKLACVVNADYSEPAPPPRRKRGFDHKQRSADGATPNEPPRGVVYSGTTGKLLLGISVFGTPAHACTPGAGVNAAALAGHLAAGLEGLPSLAMQAGVQRLPPPRVLQLADARRAYDVTTPEYAALYVNLLHSGTDLDWLWRRCLRTVRELAREYATSQRRRALDWARQAGAAGLPDKPARPVVMDYAALVPAAQAAGVAVAAPSLGPDDEPRAAAMRHVQALVAGLRSAGWPPAAKRAGHRPALLGDTPLIVLTVLPPFYPGGRILPDAPLHQALNATAQRHGVACLPLYPNIADASAFCWTPANLALAQQAPIFPTAADSGTWAGLAAPVYNVGPIGHGAHGPAERVYLPYLRDALPRLLWDALRAAANLAQ